MVNGKVKFFNSTKNFGFIAGDDGTDYFVHGGDVEGDGLRDGDAVEFNAVEGDRGPKAENVKLASASGSESSDDAVAGSIEPAEESDEDEELDKAA